MDTFVAAEPFPPSEYIQDEMKARRWGHEDLAVVMGVSLRHVMNLLSGKTGITPDTAHKLADAFGQSAASWMKLQASYELATAAQVDS